MTPAVFFTALYFLTITIKPKDGGQDVSTIILDIAKILSENHVDAKVLYKFKVVGEAQIHVVLEAANLNGLECLVNKLFDIATTIRIDNKPVITYEALGRNLGVSENLTQPVNNILLKDQLYYLVFNFDYYGNTTDQFFATWKIQIESQLSKRLRGEQRFVIYKNLAERKSHLIGNADPGFLDLETFMIPLVQAFGSNVHIQSKGLQFLEDYKTCTY